jgi:maltooligosyltrehalose trehalohydrolase
LVVFAQNHDQVGNRMLGERLSALISFEKLKLAAGIVLLSPFLPLLFMGEEYGETAPFLYFASHSDPGLIEAVRRGRRDEFREFAWQGEAPDPHAEQTFKQSKLDQELRRQGWHRMLQEFYRELIRLRRSLPALGCPDQNRQELTCIPWEKLFALRRWNEDQQVLMAFNFGERQATLHLPPLGGDWHELLNSEESKWHGHGCPETSLSQAMGETIVSLQPCSLILLAKGDD